MRRVKMKPHKLTRKELKELYEEENGSVKDRVKDALDGKCNVWRYRNDN